MKFSKWWSLVCWLVNKSGEKGEKGEIRQVTHASI